MTWQVSNMTTASNGYHIWSTFGLELVTLLEEVIT